MTKDQHHKEAERLILRAKALLNASYDPDASGESIREEWREQAHNLMAEAQVHAAFS